MRSPSSSSSCALGPLSLADLLARCSTGISGNGTFAINGPETQLDFGYRAVHLTTVYSKAIVKAYYGKAQKKSYWFGCSSGGKQGLKEVQEFPDEYDGVLAASAACVEPVSSRSTRRPCSFFDEKALF